MLPEKMQSLRHEIRSRRLINTDGKEFVPEKWLFEILTEERILDSLGTLDSIMDKDECPQVARDIWKFGRKTYATCITIEKPELIYRFLQSDQFDTDTLDKRLPIEKKKLTRMLGLTDIKKSINKVPKDVRDSDPELKRLNEQKAECLDVHKKFMAVQDMFLSPTFPQGPLHRILRDTTRLPFLLHAEGDKKAESKAQGGFGTVIKETLPSEHYGEKKGTVIVRKELKSSGKEAYRDELRCLRLLAAARHPCILELYGSYTYRMKHNLLFREAVQGDLHDLLAAEQRPPAFEEDESFYLAFCGLASALEKVHCVAIDDLKLKMIGCHHDLKPHNVLVDNGRFILADFGLATMKDPSEGPLVEAKDRDLYFLAPENIDFVQNVRGHVGPPTDIWSLGCMLLDVFTFMRGGRRAVQDFRHSRSYQDIVGGVRTGIKAYHDLRGGLNPATTRHLNKMEADFLAEAGVQSNSQRRHIPEVGIIKLVWEMLTIDPLTRPDIKRVLQRLRCITLQKKSQPVRKALLASRHANHIEFLIEKQVFYEWLHRLGEAGEKGHLYLPSDTAFEEACRTLDALLDELQFIDTDDIKSPVFNQLRRLNEQLLSCLDETGRLDIRRAVERNVLPNAQKLAKQSNLDGAEVFSVANLDALGPNGNILRLLAAAQVKQRMAQSDDQTVPRLESTDVTLLDLVEVQGRQTPPFRLGTLKEGEVEIPVVVELVTIDDKHSDVERCKRLIQRLEGVLSLGTTNTLPGFCALNCRGIYFDVDKQLIGLAYAYPPQASSSPAHVVSFAQLLAETPEPIDYENNVVVSIDDRVRLARDLALAVSNFHHIGWMHKNISSHTVLFFHDASLPPNDAAQPRPKPRHLDLSAPAFIGFSHSRKQDETTMSSKRYYTSIELRAYHHPEYTGDGTGGYGRKYRAGFDYYSLGLVLLELGHWWPLKGIVNDLGNRVALQDRVLRRSVPFLAGAIGEGYARATRACLSGELENGSVEENFSKLVIAPLEEMVTRGSKM